MKFINYLESISGVAIYPLISLIIFFVFFTLLIIYAFKVRKEQINEMKNLPFEKLNESNLYDQHS